jgi:hypothetical protein
MLCPGKPINAEVRLNKLIFEPYDSIDVEIDLGLQFKDIVTIKASLFVEI